VFSQVSLYLPANSGGAESSLAIIVSTVMVIVQYKEGLELTLFISHGTNFSFSDFEEYGTDFTCMVI
jgi:hypothetical protein